MHDAWEDCPSREQRQWLGDVTVENLVGHAAFGPCVAPLTGEVPRPGRRKPAPRWSDPDVRSRRPSGERPSDPRLDAAVDPLRRRPSGPDRRPRHDRGDLPGHPEGAEVVRAAARRERPRRRPALLALHGLVRRRPRRRGWRPERPACRFAARGGAAGDGARLGARGGAAERPRPLDRRRDRGPPLGRPPRRLCRHRRPGDRRAGPARLPARHRRDRALGRGRRPAPGAGAGPHHRLTPPDLHRRAADRAAGRDARPGRGRRAGQHLLFPLRLRGAGRAGPLRRSASADAGTVRAYAREGRDDALGEFRADRQPLPRLLGVADPPAVAADAGRGAGQARLRRDRRRGRTWPGSTMPRASCPRALAMSRSGSSATAPGSSPR